MNESNQIFEYVLISSESETIPELDLHHFLEIILLHQAKHDFAKMIMRNRISVRSFAHKNDRLIGVFVPFINHSFEDMTTLNWYVKTQALKANLVLLQLKMPDGSFIGV